MQKTSLGWIQHALLSIAVLAPHGMLQARELSKVDALGDAPLAAVQLKSLPAGVERLSREERLGLPTFVQIKPIAKSAMLSGAGRSTPETAARAEIKQLASLYGLTDAEVDAAPLHHVQTLPSGALLVLLNNQRDGIEVFRERATVLLDADMKATAIGGYLGSTRTVQASTKAASANRVDAAGAVARALQDFGFSAQVVGQLQTVAPDANQKKGPYQQLSLPPGVSGNAGATLSVPTRVKPVWFRLPDGLVSAFYVEVQGEEDGAHFAYAYVIAADDARLLLRHSLTSHAADFSYRVWADPATGMPFSGPQGQNGVPHPTGLPDGYAALLEPAQLVTMNSTLARVNAPWLADAATTTSGNNVQAFANLNGPGDSFPTADQNNCDWVANRDMIACTTAPSTFDHRYDHSRTTRADTAQVSASVVNMFYTTNWLHDWFYDSGFDEAAGNAQKVNYGTEGLDGDALIAQALDNSDSDPSNNLNGASMTTPADGYSPMMRMHRFVNASVVRARVVTQSAPSLTSAVKGALFGSSLYEITGELATTSATSNEACATLPAGSLTGKIALVDRGTCNFATKTLNAEKAGAIGIVIVNNSTFPANTMEGNGIDHPTIPAIHMAQVDGNALKAALGNGPVELSMSGEHSERSSALDNSIIAHEWGHYISNRLIGDGSGLGTNHAGGLGEGWGDFHSLLMLVKDDDRNRPGNSAFQGAYNIASYVLGRVTAPALDSNNTALFGIRRYPYSTDMTKNPLSLRHIVQGTPLPTNIPINKKNSNFNPDVHNAGEVWATMLWECYASLLNAHPFAEAQSRMKNYLVAGYKLTPVIPTLTEARDALLAPMASNDPADYARCSAAFAKRGAGMLAVIPDRYSQTNAGVIESYSTNGDLALDNMQLSMSGAAAQRCDADDVLDSGETGVLTFTVYNNGSSAVASAQLALSADLSNLSFPDGNILAIPYIATGNSITVSTRVHVTGLTAPSGSRITARLTFPGQRGGAKERTLFVPLHRDRLADSLQSDDAEALPSAMEFGSSSSTNVNAWASRVIDEAGQPVDRRYTAAGPDTFGSHWMRTPPLQVSTSENFTVSFKHRYRFQFSGSGVNYDGGQLMISTDGGTSWVSVADSAYNGTVYDYPGSRNPAKNQRAFVMYSANWPAMQSVTVDLGSAFSGQAVRFAWVIQTDQFGESRGWEVDDIVFTGITNTPFPKVITDAQTCVGTPALNAISGDAQNAQVNTAFTLPLRVRLLYPSGTPVANAAVSFAAPTTGASAALSSNSAQTDGDGYAQVTATANSIEGSYTVTASANGVSGQFTLTNTAAPVHPGGGTGGTPLSISGPSPNGQGTVTITVNGSTTALPATAEFANDQFGNESTVAVPALPGYGFPFGLAGFKLQNVGANNTVTLRIKYPADIPAGAEYWKYGKTTPTGRPQWFKIPMTQVASDTVDITLTDGAQGDSDATADGTITDPGGLAVAAAVPPVTGGTAITPVPSLSQWALVMLSMGLAWMAWMGFASRNGRKERSAR
ncbi:M36 family metallopeptidase [Diaphorobacter caeni]|uniref:M36 family metallopeptidase n=1 Tax=Diaphorobacter caeni TaxID=2784387 RepID=UPI00188F917D|nr:M36 family metallopeptidase [Diaphorobacter caeni]MBF5006650.1 M36 family metallopeptidase [Diaphorobacter caeni]